MSGSSDYTTTPNLGLYRPNYDMDDGLWGTHLNANADVLDSAIHALQGAVTGGPFLPMGGGDLTGPSSSVNPSTANPVAPGYAGLSGRYGTQAAVDIFAKILNVPPRNTFNAVEGVLTLPSTVTTFNNYHAAVAGFADQHSSAGVCFGVGAYSVASVSNTVIGAFGSVASDSPLASGAFTNVRMQNEYDWYTNNATSSVRGTLHDGFFQTAPNSGQNLIAFSNNLFIGSFSIGPASFNGTLMTAGTPTSGAFAVGMRLEATGVDGTLNTTITSLGTGTGGAGTYNISANVGTIASATVRATSSYPWNIAFMSPDGISNVALDIGQRNAATALTVGSRSQPVQWRFSDTTVSNERVMSQWIEPLASGGIMFLLNNNANTPASYGVENNFSSNGAAFVSRNRAATGFIDMLHLDASDRTVLGSGGQVVYLSTAQGPTVQLLNDAVATTNSIAVKGATATLPARIYVPGANLQLANTALSGNATLGYTSPFPVTTAAPTGVPAMAGSTNAFGVYNTTSKTLNIFDPTANGWYHVTLTVGAA